MGRANRTLQVIEQFLLLDKSPLRSRPILEQSRKEIELIEHRLFHQVLLVGYRACTHFVRNVETKVQRTHIQLVTY